MQDHGCAPVGAAQLQAEQVKYRDELITNVVLSWPWWIRPWLALRVLLGMQMHVQIRTQTEHEVGRVHDNGTRTWDWLPFVSWLREKIRGPAMGYAEIPRVADKLGSEEP